MDNDFWLRLWDNNRIPFHEAAANSLLVKHLGALALPAASRIFLPLCGKSRDIAWLLSRGHRVVGAELSGLAIAQLFEELGAVPEITTSGAMPCFRAPGIDLYVGDIFDLTATDLGLVDAVYDRAAVIALPADLRQRYADHMAAITAIAPQLLISFEHERKNRDGPPFTVDPAELTRLYGRTYDLTFLERIRVGRGPDGRSTTFDTIWLLR